MQHIVKVKPVRLSHLSCYVQKKRVKLEDYFSSKPPSVFHLKIFLRLKEAELFRISQKDRY